MPDNTRAVKLARREAKSAGPRPSVAKLMRLVDPGDPAFFHIATLLKEATESGAELGEEQVLAAVSRGRAALAEEARIASIPQSIVYYVRRRDLVKIGYTTSAAARFHNLIPDEIMAWEPGGRVEERSRHREFSHLRISKRAEYFHLTSELRRHIGALLSLHGGPDPAWTTLSNLSQRDQPRPLRPDAPQSIELVTVQEGAARLGIRPNTITVWIRRGKLEEVAQTQKGRPLYFLDHMTSLLAKGERRAT
ncbi:hypothetical protein EST92_11770 [Streptomyces sp. TM32]|uniref:hypothetical protein n=1 Tax=Streptomyces sp. TM32 TaxID=1652669 RepID=UPI001013C26F|nr:hypothetical protein [Streptomyces sp. TM32]RXS84229.1 hypothetical protein EST92_11770 [Streptomyces sp. TM32]